MINFDLYSNLSKTYQLAKPFPYVVIDNFLPEFLLDKVLHELKNTDYWFHNEQEWMFQFEVNKHYTPNFNTDYDEFQKLLPYTTLVFDYLNSDEFLNFLQKLTGHKNLFRDPKLLGGGAHKIDSGGKLSIHKDYNSHPETKIVRKLNLLIYLNKDWKEEYNGNLELCNRETLVKEVEIEPIFNRAVLFDIDDSPHGHPKPLNTPKDVSRYSLALYYFSDYIPNNPHSVVFYHD